jgi:glycosyltransferase involved in cell wall biosynthesis
MPSVKKNTKPVSVYFIVPAPLGISPGQRFRFEHYLSYLKENNIRFRISNFYKLTGRKMLYVPGKKRRKIFYVLSGFVTRLTDLFKIGGYSYVYLYREASPVGPPVFEWMIAKVLRKKIIYDFDDAIWVPVASEYNKAAYRFKQFSKVARICRWSYRVSVGNEYLAAYVRKQNNHVSVIPTVVDTEKVHNRTQYQETTRPAIGWTGTFSTLKYLDIVLPVLRQLQTQYDFTFVVIADKDPRLPLKNYRFIRWNKETEVNDLLNFHIGLMPLYDDVISKGKCGFKAIQYMSLGIPAVVSPVGVNTDIVEDGVTGFLCVTENDWKNRLEKLITSAPLRTTLGLAAKEKIKRSFSVQATKEMFLDLFR